VGVGPASGVVHFIVEGRFVLEEKVVGGSLGLLREAFGSGELRRVEIGFHIRLSWEASPGVRAF
jgi:hypothetical protein